MPGPLAPCPSEAVAPGPTVCLPRFSPAAHGLWPRGDGEGPGTGNQPSQCGGDRIETQNHRRTVAGQDLGAPRAAAPAPEPQARGPCTPRSRGGAPPRPWDGGLSLRPRSTDDKQVRGGERRLKATPSVSAARPAITDVPCVRHCAERAAGSWARPMGARPRRGRGRSRDAPRGGRPSAPRFSPWTELGPPGTRATPATAPHPNVGRRQSHVGGPSPL